MKQLLFILFIYLSFLNPVHSEEREARGLVSATEKVSISSEIAARVQSINFLLGDAFKEGDVLISFDCEIYKAQKDVIKAEHESARIQLENDKELLELRSIGKLQYQLTVSNHEKAKAELRQLEIEYTNAQTENAQTGFKLNKQKKMLGRQEAADAKEKNDR